jgi:hypothetical protein
MIATVRYYIVGTAAAQLVVFLGLLWWLYYPA